jgi:predicted nucleotidyltransferase
MENRLAFDKPIKKRKYKRQTAEKALEMVKQKIIEVNDNSEFLYYIDRAILFGSYINSDKEYVGDLDIALYTTFKGKKSKELEMNKKRAAEKDFQGNFVLSFIYGKEEVAKYIRNGKQIISLHNGNQAEKNSKRHKEKNYIYWDKSEVIYNR